jgi:spore maturation protein CgeB
LIPQFDLYLSFTGGPVLDVLRSTWGARRTAALYGTVDPDMYLPVADPPAMFGCALGYLGTYASDRQAILDGLQIEPARRRPDDRFCVVGSLYPESISWPPNVSRTAHLEPAAHPAFYSANRVTLNVTRAAMRQWGYSPSGRFFEAAACGTPILSDRWPGIEEFFEPGTEVLVADTSEDALHALDLTAPELRRIGEAARERVLAHHTGAVRAQELVRACEAAAC